MYMQVQIISKHSGLHCDFYTSFHMMRLMCDVLCIIFFHKKSKKYHTKRLNFTIPHAECKQVCMSLFSDFLYLLQAKIITKSIESNSIFIMEIILKCVYIHVYKYSRNVKTIPWNLLLLRISAFTKNVGLWNLFIETVF